MCESDALRLGRNGVSGSIALIGSRDFECFVG